MIVATKNDGFKVQAGCKGYEKKGKNARRWFDRDELGQETPNSVSKHGGP